MQFDKRDHLHQFFTLLQQWVQDPSLLLNQAQRDALQQQINQLIHYRAVVGVMGKTGVGKSSLCNALFGQDIAPTSDVDPCTRIPQAISLSQQQERGITLLDMPGVGESQQRDEQYRELYQRHLPQLDLVLWVIKADDRALAIDERFYRDVVLPAIWQSGTPILFVISQVDKLQPSRDWNWQTGQPGAQQQLNLQAKRAQLMALFRIGEHQLVATSAESQYGLAALVERIVLTLPNEKKWGLVRETRDEHISVDTWQQTGTGLWQAIKDIAKRVVGHAWRVVKTAVLGKLGKWLGG